MVIGKDEGVLKKAGKIENYYGFIDPISGTTLVENGIKQATRLGIEIKKDEVLSIDFDCIFHVKTKNTSYSAKTVLIATGAPRNTPRIHGIKEYEGKGISYCAICDGFFYKNKDVAVLGEGDYAIHEAMELLPIVNSVTILTNGKELVENRSYDISEIKTEQKEVRCFKGENKLNIVEFEDDSILNIDGVFIASGTASSVDLAKKLGIVVNGNNIVINEEMQTNVQGIYACGDCTGGLLQISKAIYEGTKAALSIAKQLKE